MDNVFIERVWRSLKHEDVYLKGYADGREARAGIGEWIVFYNECRLHQALGYRAPMAVWREGVAPGACGQRSRVDHMPTGTEADTALGGMINKENQQTDFQLSRRQKWSRCAGPPYWARISPAIVSLNRAISARKAARSAAKSGAATSPVLSVIEFS